MHYLFLLNPAAGRQDTTAQTRRRLEGALLQCGIPRQDCSFVRTMYKGHAKTLARQAARTGQPCGSGPSAATARSGRLWREPAPIPMLPWAASRRAAATIFCAPSALRPSFWIWQASCGAGWSPST